jgi:hypothetical protein
LNDPANATSNATDCQDEIISIGSANCFQKEPFEDDSTSTSDTNEFPQPHHRNNADDIFKDALLHQSYPHMRGVIYISRINVISITNCTFKYNDAGPIFNQVQINGLITYDQADKYKVERASAIFIDHLSLQVTISNSLF